METKKEQILLGYNTEIKTEPPYYASVLGENVYRANEMALVLAVLNKVHRDCALSPIGSYGAVEYTVVCPEPVRPHFARETLNVLEVIAHMGSVSSERKRIVEKTTTLAEAGMFLDQY